MIIDYDYLSKIKKAVSLYTRRKTSNILEGEFRSIYKSRSMDFEDLKEYTPGDEVHDIDWKSSSRMGTTLVRRYMTDRRHNVMFVCDCGAKMRGDTPGGEPKAEVTLLTFGTVAYMVERCGADVALAYPQDSSSVISSFGGGTDHLEELLYGYEKVICNDPHRSAEQTLKDVLDTINKTMIIFFISDVETLSRMDTNLLRAVSENHDIVMLGIEDASLFGDNVYDLDRGSYEKFFISHSKALREFVRDHKREMAASIDLKCRESRSSAISIACAGDIIDGSVILLDWYKHGNYGYITSSI
ncbi:MAG: DUF58 domain-containing protein [Lachnospiraceae bacterium]|nr:DUF58 domain-containing protein [Lachnospiraceae bacterium]